jgi:alkanesulfonate monooxygenase SsuD/methylene tetrahydromethanopterin reductase-like flavin-dependent oxidoreductase (luciferase family)
MPYELALQCGGSYDNLLSRARWAEDQGLVAFALPDHYLTSASDDTAAAPAFDAFAQMAALARETSTIALSILVSPITFRHPAVLTKMAVTIDHLSEGRFGLGIGTGWLEREHDLFDFPFPDRPERFAMMEEALAYVRAALDPDAPGHVGDRWQLEATPIAPAPVGRLPLIVGGVGRVRTPTAAGTYADEYNCYPAPVDEFAARVRTAREAAATAGRDPDALLISSAGAVMTAPTRSEYDELLAESAAAAGITPEEIEAHMDVRNTPRGTHDQVATQLAELADVGMARFYLQRPADFDTEATAKLIAVLSR